MPQGQRAHGREDRRTEGLQSRGKVTMWHGNTLGAKMDDMPYALVTGSSVGIGAAFARLLARDGYDLVLVARDETRLKSLAAELEVSLRIRSEIIVADLTTAEGLELVEHRLADTARPVEVLVNNAGFGLPTRFVDSTIEAEERQLDLLVRAPMRLTHAALPSMIARGRGYVINVGSVAAFIPANTYSAAKSWLTFFSESLQQQLQGTGVQVSVVAPGYTHTEFHQRAGMDMSQVPEALWLDAADVAAQAWADAKRGKAVSVPGLQYRTLTAAAQFLPRSLLRGAAARRPGPKLRG
jgi:short-subunit dehydrogenase